jgi:hypothetical protein
MPVFVCCSKGFLFTLGLGCISGLKPRNLNMVNPSINEQVSVNALGR